MGRRKAQEYRLSREVYQETIWFLRQYPKFVEKVGDVIDNSPTNDGPGRSSVISDPTAFKAMDRKLGIASDNLRIIRKAAQHIPEEYRKAIFDNAIYRIPYPGYANVKTYQLWRKRFVWWTYCYRQECLNSLYNQQK